MPQVQPNIETFARIKVIGVGGSGCHAIDRMVDSKIDGVSFIAVNTDAQDLHNTNVSEKLLIGKNLTRGLGTGMNPELGRQAAEESRDDIQDIVKDADMVFVTCGLGGGTGSSVSPVIAETAKNAGALTVAVVTKPFSFEGLNRARIADESWMQLKDKVDALITVPNDRLLHLIEKNTSLLEAFGIVDDVLRQGVQGISDLIVVPGIINVDFADVRTVMQESGSALMGIGKSSGDDRAVEAAKLAINSPLLDIAIDGARGVLFTISSGGDLAMSEVNEAAKVVTESIDPEARVIFGAVDDPKLNKGELKVTVIATGFNGHTRTKEEGEIEKAPRVRVTPKPKSVSEVRREEPQRDQAKAEDDDGSYLDIPAFIRRKMK